MKLSRPIVFVMITLLSSTRKNINHIKVSRLNSSRSYNLLLDVVFEVAATHTSLYFVNGIAFKYCKQGFTAIQISVALHTDLLVISSPLQRDLKSHESLLTEA